MDNLNVSLEEAKQKKKADEAEKASQRRARFLHLLDAYDITQVKSAELISAVTSRPCPVRTVRSWINDPTKPSSSPCPEWALAALEKAIHFIEQAMARRAEILTRADTDSQALS